MNNGDYPAMPVTDEQDTTRTIGMTKREAFAKAAMQGYISAGSNGMPSPESITIWAIETADTLLAELERTGGGS